MFQPLNELLSRPARPRSQESVDICDLWHKYANQVFLSKTMKAQEAIFFRDGVLVVSVGDDISKEEIKQKERSIVKKVNDELGGKIVVQVKYR